MVFCSEYYNELLDSVKEVEIPHYLSEYRLLIKNLFIKLTSKTYKLIVTQFNAPFICNLTTDIDSFHLKVRLIHMAVILSKRMRLTIY
jgi:hypothetical protein